MPALFCLLCFFKCLLLLVSALAGVTIGTSAGIVVYTASVKSRIANLLKRPPEFVQGMRPADGTPRWNKYASGSRTDRDSLQILERTPAAASDQRGSCPRLTHSRRFRDVHCESALPRERTSKLDRPCPKVP
jgi:hypothetical protein